MKTRIRTSNPYSHAQLPSKRAQFKQKKIDPWPQRRTQLLVLSVNCMKASKLVSQSARKRRSKACPNSQGLLSPHNLARRVVLVSRYRARVRLAKLEAFPEGYEWHNTLHEGKARSVILLTPPGLVAVRRSDGSWVRRPRVVARDGPAPYTQEWYSEYLRNSGLPTWFFLAGHGEVLSNAAEASLLGEELDQERGTANAAYQEIRYPSEPWAPAIEGDGTYKFRLSDAEQRCVARRFPASNVPNQGREVLLLPGGYIQLHHDPTNLDYPTLESEQLHWRKGGPASYVEEGQGTGLATVPAVDKASRIALIRKARQDGGITSLTSVPRGEGEYSWLEEADTSVAESRSASERKINRHAKQPRDPQRCPRSCLFLLFCLCRSSTPFLISYFQ